MKYIIELPKEVKEKFDNATKDEIYGSYYDYNSVIGNAIKNSTPLPKGHGDLIDRNECLKMKVTDLHDKDGITMYAVPTGNILRMKPIIEADKENKRMIPFIRESLENGNLIAKDYIATEWDGYEQGRRKIRHEHRIMLEDTRTGERVFVCMFKEGDNE